MCARTPPADLHSPTNSNPTRQPGRAGHPSSCPPDVPVNTQHRGVASLAALAPAQASHSRAHRRATPLHQRRRRRRRAAAPAGWGSCGGAGGGAPWTESAPPTSPGGLHASGRPGWRAALPAAHQLPAAPALCGEAEGGECWAAQGVGHRVSCTAHHLTFRCADGRVLTVVLQCQHTEVGRHITSRVAGMPGGPRTCRMAPANAPPTAVASCSSACRIGSGISSSSCERGSGARVCVGGGRWASEGAARACDLIRAPTLRCSLLPPGHKAGHHVCTTARLFPSRTCLIHGICRRASGSPAGSARGGVGVGCRSGGRCDCRADSGVR